MNLVQDGESNYLREKSQEVPQEMFSTDGLKNMIEGMFEVLKKETDGVALAGPQVELPYRVFVVAPGLAGVSQLAPLIYINPRLENASKEKIFMEEGCLSVRWLYGEVKRHTKVSIVAQDISGKVFKRGASGLLAHIFQHEIEHLDGTLFIDKARKVVRLDDETIRKMSNK